MEITKRNGMAEPYNKEKVAIAIRKSFASTGQSVTDETILTLVNEVENFILSDTSNRHVERIQDEVERSLMEHGFYAEAKNYILYRWQRTERRKALNHIVNETGDETITDTLKGIGQDFPRNEYSLTLLAEKFSSFYKPEMTPNERLTSLIKAAVELTTQEAPDWEFFAARLLNFQLSKKLTEQAEFAGVLSFYEKLRYLTDEGLYGSYILASYSPEEMVGKKQQDLYVRSVTSSSTIPDWICLSNATLSVHAPMNRLNPYKKCIWVLPSILQCRKGTTVCNG